MIGHRLPTPLLRILLAAAACLCAAGTALAQDRLWVNVHATVADGFEVAEKRLIHRYYDHVFRWGRGAGGGASIGYELLGGIAVFIAGGTSIHPDGDGASWANNHGEIGGRLRIENPGPVPYIAVSFGIRSFRLPRRWKENWLPPLPVNCTRVTDLTRIPECSARNRFVADYASHADSFKLSGETRTVRLGVVYEFTGRFTVDASAAVSLGSISAMSFHGEAAEQRINYHRQRRWFEGLISP